MRISRNLAVVALGAIAFVALISPALGGPSLKQLVKKEVSKQIANAEGPQGPQGQQGPPGASATTPGGTVAAGTTLTGVWAPLGESGCSGVSCVIHSGEGVSFGGYTLPVRPTAHVIGVGGNATTECPGSVTAPTALSGHLCLYIATYASASTTGDNLQVIDPVNQANAISFAFDTGITTTFGDAKADRRGFKLVQRNEASNVSQASGTWAVTG